MAQLNYAPQLQQLVASMLNEVVEDCRNVDLNLVNNRWFGEKLCYLIDNNFLTHQEIDDLFGWKSWDGAAKYMSLFLAAENLSGLNELSSQTIQRRTMALISVVAAKYRLHTVFGLEPSGESTISTDAVSEPVVAQTVEVLPPPNEDRYELLYRPLSDFQVFKMSVRAMNGLKNEGIKFLGDLARCTGQELNRIPNMGKVSVAEIKVALDTLPFGLSLGCLTTEEQLEFDARKWLNDHAGEALRLSTLYPEWSAPSELVEQLKQRGIIEKTQLATCPREVIDMFLTARRDLEKMLEGGYSMVAHKLFVQVPRQLNSAVQVYTPVPVEVSPTSPE